MARETSHCHEGSSMDIVPVKKYNQPNYPDRKMVVDNPEILKLAPERWKNNTYVGVALSTLLMLTLTACESKGTSTGVSSAGKTTIAPIFEHGSGRGSFGCVSVSPPSFLSEEEAFQVIQEEAKGYGIMFKRDGLELTKVKLPETKGYLKPENGDKDYKSDGGVINSKRTGDLRLDGYDEEKKVAFEFISTIDYQSWKVKEGMQSTVEDYDFISTARLLKDGLNKKNGDTSIGIFYNPMTMMSWEEIKEEKDFKVAEEKTKKLAREELRKQVRDFLEWLIAQGII
jgi:hypothetical protein